MGGWSGGWSEEASAVKKYSSAPGPAGETAPPPDTGRRGSRTARPTPGGHSSAAAHRRATGPARRTR